MIKILTNAECYLPEGNFIRADVLVVGSKICAIGTFSNDWISKFPVSVETIDCENFFVAPGLIDPHLHLSGGSGEGGGFFSQSPQVLVSECVFGGVTTVVGTLGVDTTTKTMPDLLAKVKAYNEIGLKAYCYVGGYDIPPKTITGSVRDDLIFIPEIIGVGELAIADGRAPEPDLKDLARVSIDAYVGGMLTGKAGVTHFHVGDGAVRLKSVRELMSHHVIDPSKMYMTHVERSEALVDEGIELAKKGCFIDFDIHERDLHRWYKYYRENGGPLTQLTVSSDAGVSSPKEVWEEIRKCVLEHDIPLGNLLSHFTLNTAKALKFSSKGKLCIGCDADLIIFSKNDLELNHVLAHGKWMLKDQKLQLTRQPHLERRKFDIYEVHQTSN